MHVCILTNPHMLGFLVNKSKLAKHILVQIYTKLAIHKLR